MANKLPKNVSREVRNRTYAKCDEYGYSSRSRTENTAFMNSLVEEPEIGGRLREYMTGEEVRTYIKDTLLNAYAKANVKRKLACLTPMDVVLSVFAIETDFVGRLGETSICRSCSNAIYLVQTGTLLKWETALRKVLECVAAHPHLSENSSSLEMCLLLVVTNDELSYGDRQQIEVALGFIGVKVFFAQ